MSAGESSSEASYAPGSWAAVAGARTWLLADVDPRSALVAQCWAAIRDGADADTVLGILADEGLRSIPSFALADTGQLFVRGAATATLTDQAGTATEVSAAGVRTWLTRELDGDLSRLELRAAGAGGESGGLPLTGGVTVAASIQIVRSESSVPSELEPVAEPEPAPEPEPEPIVPEAPALPIDEPSPTIELQVSEDGEPLVEPLNLTKIVAMDAGPSDTVVLAVRCPNGHLSAADAEHCRICYSVIPEQEPFSVSRPVLGALRLSSGPLVLLDRDIIFGRAPEPPPGGDAEQWQLVAVPSPGNDISRSHVDIHIDGWRVLVTDLGSTNGTVITPHGQAPHRLTPHEAEVIDPGAVVNLADEVTLQYEIPLS